MESHGLKVARVGDGVEAFLALQRDHHPVLVLAADLPRIGGSDLCEIIKGTEELKSTGLVLLRSEATSSGLASVGQGGAHFDLEVDEADPEGRLLALLESYGLRVEKEVVTESRMATPEVSPPAPDALDESMPSDPPKVLSGEEAERAKAERLARIVVSDMLLYHPERFDQVESESGLLDEFASEIREGGLLLSKRVDAEVLSERDFLGDELRKAARQRAQA